MHRFDLLLAGLLFGLGLTVSGMVNPAKVLNFFDVFGHWDPSLALVMAAALLVTAVGYRIAWRRGRPVCAAAFDLPPRRAVDARLVSGAAVFGVGWGLAGFCPGGVLPALASGQSAPWVFFTALVTGMCIARAVDRLRSEDKRHG
ncbi:MAG: membrane protein [Gammaproteobacteria bacterium]|nr:MAG: membrane protein [Gammaproteobacteria bacterium]